MSGAAQHSQCFVLTDDYKTMYVPCVNLCLGVDRGIMEKCFFLFSNQDTALKFAT